MPLSKHGKIDHWLCTNHLVTTHAEKYSSPGICPKEVCCIDFNNYWYWLPTSCNHSTWDHLKRFLQLRTLYQQELMLIQIPFFPQAASRHGTLYLMQDHNQTFTWVYRGFLPIKVDLFVKHWTLSMKKWTVFTKGGFFRTYKTLLGNGIAQLSLTSTNIGKDCLQQVCSLNLNYFCNHYSGGRDIPLVILWGDTNNQRYIYTATRKLFLTVATSEEWS